MGTPSITVAKIVIYSVKCRATILKWTRTNAAWESIELLVNNHAMGRHQCGVHAFASR